jgi:hypothetical protein
MLTPKLRAADNDDLEVPPLPAPAPTQTPKVDKALPQDETNPQENEGAAAELKDEDKPKSDDSDDDSEDSEDSEKSDPVAESLHLPADKSKWTRFDMINYHRELIHQMAASQHSFDFVSQSLLSLGVQIYGPPANQIFWPSLQFQQTVASHWALGVKSTLYAYQQYTDIGGMITASFFLHKPFDGFDATLGMGLGSVSNDIDSGVAFSSSLMVGGHWFLGAINIGFQVGFANYNFFGTAGTPQNVLLFLPIAELNFGFAL